MAALQTNHIIIRIYFLGSVDRSTLTVACAGPWAHTLFSNLLIWRQMGRFVSAAAVWAARGLQHGAQGESFRRRLLNKWTAHLPPHDLCVVFQSNPIQIMFGTIHRCLFILAESNTDRWIDSKGARGLEKTQEDGWLHLNLHNNRLSLISLSVQSATSLPRRFFS